MFLTSLSSGGWAQRYVQDWVDDPRGTGGTPYRAWLRQLIDDTPAWRRDD